MADDRSTPTTTERLAPLVGTWTMQARFPQGPADATAETVFAWMLGGRYLVQRSRIDAPAAPDAVAVISANPDGETYTQHYFDDRGVTRLYAMTFTPETWTLTRTTPDFSPLDFSQRFVARVDVDAGTIRGAWETSRDGTTWEHDFALDYARVDPIR
jgi:hypothetical protein